MECAQTVCNICTKISFLQQNQIYNWWKLYHFTTLITCQNMWSLTVIQKLNVLWSILWTIPKNNFADFFPLYTSTLIKILLFSYYTSLVIAFRAYLYEDSIVSCNCNISCHGAFSISVIKSRIFDQSFLRNIWKCYMLTPFCHNTHVNWL